MRLFFNKAEVIREIGKTNAQVFGAFGRDVRREGQTSIKSGGRKEVQSAPGQPPRSHSGRLKRGILFASDPLTRRVVIGPILQPPTFVDGDGQPLGNDTIPSVLEHGGSIYNTVRRGKRIEKQVVKIAPRPYMTPALGKVLPRVPSLYKKYGRR